MKYIVISALSLLFAEVCISYSQSPGKISEISRQDSAIVLAGSPLGIAAGFPYGYQGEKPYEFMSEVRSLGAGFSKVYLFWNQIEPRKGEFDWTAVDKYVNQLHSPEEGLISLFSSSQWATERQVALLPPSPAKNADDYYHFVYETVRHCQGRVRYWENDAEPNNALYWSGTQEQFVVELQTFYRAVKAADPSAVVIVGGYDGNFGPPGTFQYPNQQAGLAFFDYVLKNGRDAFDIFDLRLYGDPYTIVARVDYMRQKMVDLGFNKPIICTEYGGPNLFEFHQNLQYIPMLVSWMQQSTAAPAGYQPTTQPAKNPVADLYAKPDTLAPQTQMFMQGCPPELDAKYQRIQARGIVMRNVFALSAGVQKTVYWYLPESLVVGEARFDLMDLMYGKIGLIGFHDGVFSTMYPGAKAFLLMAESLKGVRQVSRIEVLDKPATYLFRVDREQRGPVYVVWERRDAFSGEDSPADAFELEWHFDKAKAVDALGTAVETSVSDGKLKLALSLTPIFIEAGR